MNDRMAANAIVVVYGVLPILVGVAFPNLFFVVVARSIQRAHSICNLIGAPDSAIVAVAMILCFVGCLGPFMVASIATKFAANLLSHRESIVQSDSSN